MQQFFWLTIFIYFFLPYSTSLKCHYCSGYDYIPANVQVHLNMFNISLDDIDTTQLSGNCKSRDDDCSNATWCGKKTAEYSINFNGVKYTYHTFYKTCLNNDTKTEAENDKCYNASTGGAPTTFEGGITRSLSWCYCNDKDYCNSSMIKFLNFSIIIMSLFFFS